MQKLQCLTHWSFFYSSIILLFFPRCLFNCLGKIYVNHFNQLKYHLSPLYRAYIRLFTLFIATLSIINLISTLLSELFLLAIYSSSNAVSNDLFTRASPAIWLILLCRRGARAASGNDRPRTGDPCSCLAVHLDRTDFASGSTVHVDEFTCAFRHRRIRQSWREREGGREGGREGLV